MSKQITTTSSFCTSYPPPSAQFPFPNKQTNFVA
jgi:hypothetical protein